MALLAGTTTPGINAKQYLSCRMLPSVGLLRFLTSVIFTERQSRYEVFLPILYAKILDLFGVQHIPPRTKVAFGYKLTRIYLFYCFPSDHIS